MDPDEALDRIRALAEQVIANPDAAHFDGAADLAEQVIALDEWLSRGGFPPGAWVAEPDAAPRITRAVSDPG
jgi:hypothetical protein